MRIITLILITIIVALHSLAQTVTFKRDTIVANGSRYAILESEGNKPKRYIIKSLAGERLIDIHDSRTNIKNSPGYMITFCNDRKQSMIVKDAKFPTSFIKELVRRNVIKGAAIDTLSETDFIKQHPLPEGYTDVEQLINF